MSENLYLENIKGMVEILHKLVAMMGCSNPEHQKKIEDLQAAIQNVRDVLARMDK